MYSSGDSAITAWTYASFQSSPSEITYASNSIEKHTLGSKTVICVSKSHSR